MVPDPTYENEPADIFVNLPPSIYRELYDLEMSGFQDDVQYYRNRLSGKRTVLELGCGSGRITRLLSQTGFSVTGCDISLPMLIEAKRNAVTEKYVCMDMLHTGFSTRFDSVIIPYNTLNLLITPDAIRQCLENCRSLLTENGILLLQLFTPSTDILSLSKGESSFQFQLFDNPQGGKVVKEVLRRYDRTTNLLTMTERYRIRPMQSLADNINYSQTLKLFIPGFSFWSEILSSTGFNIYDTVNEYGAGIPAGAGTVLIHALTR
ncbi:bifunctional 2-polyprenyl-6-hydroxyphenol methylase/3-demethylubiquinol 3-O-methyltransferase UbiG [Desulfopila sp. IMCC35008]|uniref:class I SAM-dependent methyltransferase n=1 Tax=Desulfopila sp. IMCC35008 TaxID=2653858 RepID=UPI0013D74E99|nr:class I SAM-dependent methyltransferase [Desulfopila sp. IMCC35008]